MRTFLKPLSKSFTADVRTEQFGQGSLVMK